MYGYCQRTGAVGPTDGEYHLNSPMHCCLPPSACLPPAACLLPPAIHRMLEIPERELRAKVWATSQRPTLASLLEDLRRVPGGADPGLLESMARGAAFHHAGGTLALALLLLSVARLLRPSADNRAAQLSLHHTMVCI